MNKSGVLEVPLSKVPIPQLFKWGVFLQSPIWDDLQYPPNDPKRDKVIKKMKKKKGGVHLLYW